MKIGKEGMAGVIAALQAWETRDHAGIRAREQQALNLWVKTLEERPGITPVIDPDPTFNPLDRLKIWIDPEGANISAWDLADRLAKGERPVIVRDHEVEHGYFYLDPCNLHPDEEFIVADRLTEELDAARKSNTPIISDLRQRMLAQESAALAWPD